MYDHQARLIIRMEVVKGIEFIVFIGQIVNKTQWITLPPCPSYVNLLEFFSDFDRLFITTLLIGFKYAR